ncbi:ABC transporter ATP-binding protein [Salarchaeum japonicum]|uniref:ABC transporter ATP-binding protein n=1 Tax=Salarchaeum japonicum TaxID=555573 RepID=UPI003C78C018
MSTPEEESVFDTYRDRVERPLYRLFSEYGVSEWQFFAGGMAANVVARAASLLPPLLLGAAIDSVFTGDSAFSLPVVPASWLPATAPDATQFQFAAVAIVVSFFVTAVFTWLYGVAANLFAHRVMHAVRTDSFEKMQRLDMTFFDDKQTGEVMSVLNNDASNLEVFLDNALQNTARLAVMVVGIAGIMLWMNWQLAVVTLAAIPLIVLLTLWFMRKVEPRYVAQRQSIGDLNTRLENALSGVELVKTSNTESYETGRVRDASYSFFQDTMSVLKLNYLYRPGMELLAGLSFAVTFVVGGIWLFQGPPLFFSGTLSTGEFVTFILLTQRFVTPLAEVSNIVDQYENAKASSERVFGLRDIPVRIQDDPDATDISPVDGRIEYDDVTFGYESDPYGDPDDDTANPLADEDVILDGVSFDADPGETTALVGPTGAGKSTILKLLMRLYDVDDGEIRVDGHDIRDVTLESLRGAIGYVGQDTFLFDGTIAENIKYGEFDADREDVVEAAKAAEAHQFITEMPNGYDTRVGERGVKLSGGQRQRVSIARTVLQDPQILILDEATSAVDTETEFLIQRSLDRLSEDRTTFSIAHRLSTVKNADQILVVEAGEVAERGTHDELLAKDGVYAALWNAQTGDRDRLKQELDIET